MNEFTFSEIREINWKYWYLRQSPEIELLNPRAESLLDKLTTINDTVDKLKGFHNGEAQAHNFIDKIDKYYQQALIPESSFDWLDNNERLYKWLNAYLVQYENKVNNNYFNEDGYRQGIILFFDQITISINYPDEFHYKPIFGDKRSITQYHEVLDTLSTWGNEFLEEIKLKWSEVYRYGDDFSWLNKKDKSQLLWAQNHMKRKNISQLGIHVNSDKDLFSSIIAMFDSWTGTGTGTGSDCEFEKKCFIMQMKKALNQKKQRDKLDGKKAYNIVMSEDIKQKLNDLAKYHDRKINQTLERLINEEYERVCNN